MACAQLVEQSELCAAFTYPQQHIQPAQGEALKHTTAWLLLQLLLPLRFCTLQGMPADGHASGEQQDR